MNRFILLLMMMIATIATQVRAVTVFVTTLETQPVDALVEVGYNQWLGTSFVGTEGAAPMYADNVSLRIDCIVPNANVFVGVVGSINGAPDMTNIRARSETRPLVEEVPHGSTLLVNLNFRDDPSRQALIPGETYWLVFGVTAPDWESPNPGGLYHWSYAAQPVAALSPPGWGPTNISATGNTAGQNWSLETNSPYSYSLVLASIPEPGTAGAIASTLGFVAVRRRRQLMSRL